MKVDVSYEGDVAVARLQGALDLASALATKRLLLEEIAAGGSRLVIDLAEVPFMDSTGLTAIVSALKAARVAGGDVRLARAPDIILRLLQLTSLDRVLGLFGTVADAVRDLESPDAKQRLTG